MLNLLQKICFLVVKILRKGYDRIYLSKLYESLGEIGDHSKLTSGVNIINPANVFIGANSYINGGMLYAGKNSRIFIGNDCLISYEVHMRCVSHVIDNPDELIRNQGEWEADIKIGNNVWIGFGAQIMPGVEIGDNSVIGAGAVVTKNIESNCVVGGVPARLIRKRK